MKPTNVLVIAFLAATAAQQAVAQNSRLEATVVDRSGNRHEVSRVAIQNRNDIEVYVGDRRRLLMLQDIERFRLEGDPNDEEQAVAITMRTGQTLKGEIITGGGTSPHQDTFGGGGLVQLNLSGVTDLGPILIMLSDISEVILRHADAAKQQRRIAATVINQDGERFEVTDLVYRGKRRFDYAQGLKLKSKDMARMSRLEFEETSAGTESRTVTITFRSGKSVQGSVDASTVRLAGESHRQYADRIGSAFTGQSRIQPFSIGLHDIKLIRFHDEETEEGEGVAPLAAP